MRNLLSKATVGAMIAGAALTVAITDYCRGRIEPEAPDAADKKPDSLRRTFQRNVATLQSHEMIGIWNDFAWVR